MHLHSSHNPLFADVKYAKKKINFWRKDWTVDDEEFFVNWKEREEGGTAQWYEHDIPDMQAFSTDEVWLMGWHKLHYPNSDQHKMPLAALPATYAPMQNSATKKDVEYSPLDSGAYFLPRHLMVKRRGMHYKLFAVNNPNMVRDYANTFCPAPGEVPHHELSHYKHNNKDTFFLNTQEFKHLPRPPANDMAARHVFNQHMSGSALPTHRVIASSLLEMRVEEAKSLLGSYRTMAVKTMMKDIAVHARPIVVLGIEKAILLLSGFINPQYMHRIMKFMTSKICSFYTGSHAPICGIFCRNRSEQRNSLLFTALQPCAVSDHPRSHFQASLALLGQKKKTFVKNKHF